MITNHINDSPFCPLVQSEINFIPRNPECTTKQSRILTFSLNTRFSRRRAGFPSEQVDRILEILVNSGFYFASQANDLPYFDQIECYFCEAAFSCDVFHCSDLTDNILSQNHANQNRQCSFLIGQVGPREFLRLLNSPQPVVLHTF